MFVLEVQFRLDAVLFGKDLLQQKQSTVFQLFCDFDEHSDIYYFCPSQRIKGKEYKQSREQLLSTIMVLQRNQPPKIEYTNLFYPIIDCCGCPFCSFV